MEQKTPSLRKNNFRIFIVDDHSIMRYGLSQLIGDEDDMEVCGEAEGVTQALQNIAKIKPDLAIVDISLKDGSGIDLISQIKSISPTTCVLVVSMHDAYIYADRALRAGAMGFVNKQEATDTIVDAIRQILNGKIYLTEAVSSRLLSQLVGAPKGPALASVANLTNRELEIFELIGQGNSTRGIAQKLHLSIKTIESHRANIKRKLCLESAQELARRAIEWVLENTKPK